MSGLLKTSDVARRLSLSCSHVYRLTREGKLPKPKRVGRSLRWEPAAIEKYIKTCGDD